MRPRPPTPKLISHSDRLGKYSLVTRGSSTARVSPAISSAESPGMTILSRTPMKPTTTAAQAAVTQRGSRRSGEARRTTGTAKPIPSWIPQKTHQ